MTSAFADPAKYDLYDCKQLEAERKSLADRAAELQGLMAKAETGVAGPVVAELAYRNDYIAVARPAKFADEAWRRNKCQRHPPLRRPAPARLRCQRRPSGACGPAVRSISGESERWRRRRLTASPHARQS